MNKHNEECKQTLRPIEIKVVPGTSVNILTQPADLDDGECYNLAFCLSCPQEGVYETIVGNEPVTIQCGTTAALLPLTEFGGNIFYAGKLYPGRCYRLKFGINGLPKLVKHFECLNTPKCAFFNPGNANSVEVV
jgi:hypothetical protein